MTDVSTADKMNLVDELEELIEKKKAECAQLDIALGNAKSEVKRQGEYIEQLKVEVRCVQLEPTDNLYRIYGEETGHQHWQYVFATSFEAAMELYTLTQENDIGKVELVVRNYCLTGKTTSTMQELEQRKRAAVDEALDRIYNQHGGVTVELVVSYSADRNSSLHGYFDWDETAEARGDRKKQAYAMIMDSKMTITYQETKDGIASKTLYGPASDGDSK